MKQLKSFMIMHINGVDRVSYTYDEYDNDEKLISSNNKGNFICADSVLKGKITSIKNYITDNKLSE